MYNPMRFVLLILSLQLHLLSITLWELPALEYFWMVKASFNSNLAWYNFFYFSRIDLDDPYSVVVDFQFDLKDDLPTISRTHKIIWKKRSIKKYTFQLTSSNNVTFIIFAIWTVEISISTTWKLVQTSNRIG